MTYPNRSSKKNGHKWREVSSRAKRQWLRAGAVRCALCGHWIDLNAEPASDWSLSVDHIVPVSINPKREYDITNFQPACLACNKVRQDRDLATILRDRELFRREVELAVEKRQVAKAKRAAAIAPQPSAAHNLDHGPSSRDWWSGGAPVETPEQRERRLAQWRALPPEWRSEVAADRDWL